MDIRCKSRKQLASEFGVDPKTFRRMLKRHNLDVPLGLLTPEWVEKIYQTLGRPTQALSSPAYKT
jgi:methylphosphotriester-DNA--protein-cysteine methyltransferase